MTDDQVFDAVRRLVADGEYRDDIPGTPGTRLDGGWQFALLEHGVRQRIYQRSSPEHLEARAVGDTATPITFTDWLADWVRGRLFQPVGFQDPDTGEWRGATRDERAAALEDA